MGPAALAVKGEVAAPVLAVDRRSLGAARAIRGADLPGEALEQRPAVDAHEELEPRDEDDAIPALGCVRGRLRAREVGGGRGRRRRRRCSGRLGLGSGLRGEALPDRAEPDALATKLDDGDELLEVLRPVARVSAPRKGGGVNTPAAGVVADGPRGDPKVLRDLLDGVAG